MHSTDSQSTNGSPACGQAQFPATHWTVVLRAAGPASAGADQALADLCAAYWYPLYAHTRRSGYTREEAEDLIQSFFAGLLEKKALQTISPEGGRFRSYLLAMLKNFLHNEWKKGRAQKRGGNCLLVSLEASSEEEFETRYLREPADPLAPDKLYEQSCALAMLETTLRKLALEYKASGKETLFKVLEPFLSGADRLLPYAMVAAELGLTEQNVKVSVHRLRRRFGELLREEVAKYAADPAQVDAEINELKASLL